eukprot:TRINITY_DN4228_c0_g1_i1.p1 TRINITY_DN4228_c0_g1~~TRINITY_DN4228_c0_g1_i1.p1  ORF type:complete len:389 (-),score=108.66 TRINITY_DN4228_c0_g1_i1:235-1260(-)
MAEAATSQKRRMVRSAKTSFAIGLAVAAVSSFSLQKVSSAFSAAGLSSPAAATSAAVATPLAWRRMPASAAEDEMTVLFVNGDSNACGARSAATAMAASPTSATNPGAAPGQLDFPEDDDEVPEEFRRGGETKDEMFGRVEHQKAWLRKLKGKFVPYGPKPWDKRQFTKVCIQAHLEAKQAANTKILNQCVEEIRRLSGKHPRVVKAKVNNANFGWRIGAPCGVAVTLRGQLMYDFLARLNTVVLPRVRDFEGLFPNSFDAYGNFWMHFSSQEPFRELDALIDERQLVHGFEVGIVNNALTQPDGLKLMKDFGFPFGDPRPAKSKVKVDPYAKFAKADKKR